VAGGFQETQAATAEGDFVAVADAVVREGGVGAGPDVNGGAGAGRQIAMTGNEIGVEMGFDDVGDAQSLTRGLVEVEVHVALRVHHDGDAFRAEHVGGMSQAGQIELLKVHGAPPSEGCKARL
jgi:hypothetical protein